MALTAAGPAVRQHAIPSSLWLRRWRAMAGTTRCRSTPPQTSSSGFRTPRRCPSPRINRGPSASGPGSKRGRITPGSSSTARVRRSGSVCAPTKFRATSRSFRTIGSNRARTSRLISTRTAWSRSDRCTLSRLGHNLGRRSHRRGRRRKALAAASTPTAATLRQLPRQTPGWARGTTTA